IGKILEREPDWSALPAQTPARIRRVLLRCLAKDPWDRLRDIGDVRLEIDGIEEVSADVSKDVAPRRAEKTRRWLPWIAVVTLAAAVAVFETRRSVPIAENPLANARFSRVTNWDGDESHAAISPDGKWVAFFSDRAGQMDLWLDQLDTGQFRNLTEG